MKETSDIDGILFDGIEPTTIKKPCACKSGIRPARAISTRTILHKRFLISKTNVDVRRMSSREEHYLAHLTIEQEEEKKIKKAINVLKSSTWCWRTQHCVLHVGHDSVCIRDLGW